MVEGTKHRIGIGGRKRRILFHKETSNTEVITSTLKRRSIQFLLFQTCVLVEKILPVLTSRPL